MDTSAAGFTHQAVVIYRCCKSCEKAAGHRVAKRVIYRVRRHTAVDSRWGGTRTVSRDFMSPSGEILSRYAPHQIPAIACELCGRSMLGRVVEGHINASVPCDARCTGAVGHQCECSCGGKNHGVDHAA